MHLVGHLAGWPSREITYEIHWLFSFWHMLLTWPFAGCTTREPSHEIIFLSNLHQLNTKGGFGLRVCIWCLCFFFFFCTRLWVCDYCSCTIQWTVAANFDFSNFFSQSVHIVHCSWTHKFHFLATFSLKMGPTVLFTYLKIILLQYFLVFSFSFQFSAVFKWTLNLLQLNLTKYKEIN